MPAMSVPSRQTQTVLFDALATNAKPTAPHNSAVLNLITGPSNPRRMRGILLTIHPNSTIPEQIVIAVPHSTVITSLRCQCPLLNASSVRGGPKESSLACDRTIESCRGTRTCRGRCRTKPADLQKWWAPRQSKRRCSRGATTRIHVSFSCPPSNRRIREKSQASRTCLRQKTRTDHESIPFKQTCATWHPADQSAYVAFRERLPAK